MIKLDLEKYSNEQLRQMAEELFQEHIAKESELRVLAKQAYGQDTVYSMLHVAPFIAKELGNRLGAAVAPKAKVKKVTVSKQTKREKFNNEVITACLDIFTKYPELTALPVYAWGRYYKYESRGNSFESCPEMGFVNFIDSMDVSEGFQEELLDEIDSKEETIDYCPSRSECVKLFNFDEQGGMLVYVKKETDGTLGVDVMACDSPE